MQSRYSLDRMLNTDALPSEYAAHGVQPGDTTGLLAARLKSLVDQRNQTQQRSAFLNTSPLGETSPQDAQAMVDLSQSIAGLGQKVANPTRGIQFAPEPRISTTPNAMQSAWAGERAASTRAGALAGQSAARSLDAMNIANARAEDADFADPAFSDVAGAKARYTAGANRRIAALGRQSMGGY